VTDSVIKTEKNCSDKTRNYLGILYAKCIYGSRIIAMKMVLARINASESFI
jgi:hypothetical protein